MFLLPIKVLADDRIINLIVAYKTVNFADKKVQAIAVNNQIPGPTLHFKEGDHVTINVYNHLNTGTTIHWHGLIVPWQMDGVAMVSQLPIPPGGVFHYQFTLHQSGTYWYHAHQGLQEQQGLYGAIIIDPPHQQYHYNKDYAIVLSDWSNTDPEKIYANLKKDGEYYSPKFPLQSSLSNFLQAYHQAKTPQERSAVVQAYKMMQQMRMDLYDISDVAYDAFLLNGHTLNNPWKGQVNVGDIVRLRFIGASSATIFHVKIPGTAMQMIQVDGNAVRPYTVNDFTIAPGETYDVLVKITHSTPYIIYAAFTDDSGAAYGALVNNFSQPVNYHAVPPFPRPKPQDMMSMNMDADESMPNMTNMDMGPSKSMPGMMNMGADKSMPNMMTMNGHVMNMSTDAMSSSDNKYQQLVSLQKTNDPNKPFHIIKIVLSGYMDRYQWFINGVPEYKAKPIIFIPGQRYRFIFINQTMMHHPMHLHGHWFILRNGHGAYDPLLHTIDVPPYATVIADVDADASGQWYFHCHILYHMMAGMTTLVRYQTPPVPATNADNTVSDNVSYLPGHDHAEWFAANQLELGADPFDNIYQGTLKSYFGPDNNKLQTYAEEAEINDGTVENASTDIFYWHGISEFWAIKGGMNYIYRPGTPYWQPGIGIEGVAPYFIDTDIRTYLHDGSEKFDINLSRDTQITNNFFINLGIHTIAATKTVTSAEIGSGLNSIEYTIKPYYRITTGVNLFIEYDHTEYYGETRVLQQQDQPGEPENVVTAGIALLF